MWASWMGLNEKKWKFNACDMHVVTKDFPMEGEDKKGMLRDIFFPLVAPSTSAVGVPTLLEAIGRAWHARSAEVVASAQLHEAELRMRVTANATAWPYV